VQISIIKQQVQHIFLDSIFECSAFVQKAHFNLLLNLGTFGKVPHYFISQKVFNLPGVCWFFVPNEIFLSIKEDDSEL